MTGKIKKGGMAQNLRDILMQLPVCIRCPLMLLINTDVKTD